MVVVSSFGSHYHCTFGSMSDLGYACLAPCIFRGHGTNSSRDLLSIPNELLFFLSRITCFGSYSGLIFLALMHVGLVLQ